jgi:hypothetical protein
MGHIFSRTFFYFFSFFIFSARALLDPFSLSGGQRTDDRRRCERAEEKRPPCVFTLHTRDMTAVTNRSNRRANAGTKV